MNGLYKKALENARTELAVLQKERTELDQRIDGLKCSIVGLEVLCNETPVQGQLLNPARIAAGEDVGLSDSIRDIIAASFHPMPTTTIRDHLVAEGYDPKQYSNFLTVIHNTLKRLASQGEVELLRSGFLASGLGTGWVPNLKYSSKGEKLKLNRKGKPRRQVAPTAGQDSKSGGNPLSNSNR